MQGLRTLLILASFCFLETAASQAAAGALTGLSRGGTGAPVPDGRDPGSSAGSHVTAETKAPLDSIVLTNQAGLSWALQNFDKGWALGTISLHGKPVEAQASNGMLILHNVITGEQRWITAGPACPVAVGAPGPLGACPGQVEAKQCLLSAERKTPLLAQGTGSMRRVRLTLCGRLLARQVLLSLFPPLQAPAGHSGHSPR